MTFGPIWLWYLIRSEYIFVISDLIGSRVQILLWLMIQAEYDSWSDLTLVSNQIKYNFYLHPNESLDPVWLYFLVCLENNLWYNVMESNHRNRSILDFWSDQKMTFDPIWSDERIQSACNFYSDQNITLHQNLMGLLDPI